MEYLKERYPTEKTSVFSFTFPNYKLNVDILKELNDRNIEIELKENIKSTTRKLNSMFIFNEAWDNYEELVSNIADEIEETDFRSFDTLACSTGVIINPKTLQPVVGFLTRINAKN